MSKLISPSSKVAIELMLTDPRIAERVFENHEDKDKYKICTVSDTGTVIMGKTSCRWWNNLIKCQDKLSFSDFAFRVWSALVDLSDGINKEAITKGLSQEIIERSVRDNRHDEVINRLLDCWRHVAQNSAGFQKPDVTDSIHQKDILRGKPETKIVERNIVLNLNGTQKIIPIVDSIGDPINLAMKVGFTGVEVL